MGRLTVTHKAWILGGCTILIFFGVNLSFGLVGYSTRSASECASCHEDAYKSWEKNKIHTTSIECVYCHSQVSSSSGYIPATFFAVEKELDNKCLGCHANFMDKKKLDTTLSIEWIDDKDEVQKAFGPWKLKEVTCRGKISCLACHKNVAHDMADFPTNLPRADYCAACHHHSKDEFSRVSPGSRLVLVIMKNGQRSVSPGIR